METWEIWGVVTALLIVAELLTGTFYLLAIASGTVCGALVAYATPNVIGQVVVASIVSCIAVYGVHWKRKLIQPKALESLDVGQSVTVLEWTGDSDLRVQYRGTQWQARLKEGVAKGESEYVIRAMHGSMLILDQKHRKE